MQQTNEQTEPLWIELETLETRLGQLQALLLNTHGDALDSFGAWQPHIREAYLSHCAEFAGALRDQANGLMNRARSDGHAGE